MKTRLYSDVKEDALKNLPFLRRAMAELKRDPAESCHRPRTESKIDGLVEFYSRKARSMTSSRDEATGMRVWHYPVATDCPEVEDKPE